MREDFESPYTYYHILIAYVLQCAKFAFSDAGLKDRNRFIFASYLPSYDRSILGTFALAHMLSTVQRPSSNQVFSGFLSINTYTIINQLFRLEASASEA